MVWVAMGIAAIAIALVFRWPFQPTALAWICAGLVTALVLQLVGWARIGFIDPFAIFAIPPAFFAGVFAAYLLRKREAKE